MQKSVSFQNLPFDLTAVHSDLNKYNNAAPPCSILGSHIHHKDTFPAV